MGRFDYNYGSTSRLYDDSQPGQSSPPAIQPSKIPLNESVPNGFQQGFASEIYQSPDLRGLNTQSGFLGAAQQLANYFGYTGPAGSTYQKDFNPQLGNELSLSRTLVNQLRTPSISTTGASVDPTQSLLSVNLSDKERQALQNRYQQAYQNLAKAYGVGNTVSTERYKFGGS